MKTQGIVNFNICLAETARHYVPSCNPGPSYKELLYAETLLFYIVLKSTHLYIQLNLPE